MDDVGWENFSRFSEFGVLGLSVTLPHRTVTLISPKVSRNGEIATLVPHM
jgi:hypothetical protein